MLRAFSLTLLCTLKLFSCSNEFAICQDKARDSHVFLSAYPLSIVVQNKNRLILAPSRPQRSVKKYDSFLGLALIDDRSGFGYPYAFHSKSDKNIASIHAKGFIKGALEQEQCGLDTLGVFSTPLKTPSLLSDSCCSLVGMGTSRGVIDSYYIKHFLQYNSNELQYGDAGIRLERRKNGLHVSEVDPFFPDQKFQIMIKLSHLMEKK